MPSSALALSFIATLLVAQTEEPEIPFTDAQLDYLEQLREELREEMMQGGGGGAAAPAAAPSVLEIRAETYMKWLYRNNTSQGCVTYGNPHPRGDNYTGDNGACPEIGLTIIGRPSAKIEGGFRLQSRFGQDFADWFETGDRREVPDASGESLGANHGAPIQLRAVYVRIAEPLPLIDWVLAGSSDLAYWDPWTVGKVRFIDRHNAKGLFLKAHAGEYVDVLLARIAMSKLFGTAGYNSLEDDLITNPFWARDAIYAAQLATPKRLIDGVHIVLNGAVSVDEEANTDDPDAPGSINTIDKKDGVTAADERFLGINGSLTLELTRWDFLEVKGVFAVSHNDPNERYASNLAVGLGFSNVVYDQVTDFAGTLRVELPDILGEGRSIKVEYFNIGADFNSIAGSRREADVLLTDGLMEGGQLPTLNVANELIDFSDEFYESVVGWHGATLVVEQQGDLLDFSVEGTYVDYNTDLQDRDMTKYPAFGGFTGFTDTDLFSYANTNDRGRDPRTVYRRDQARSTIIAVGKLAFKPDWWDGASIDLKGKVIFDEDLRDDQIPEDDYSGIIVRAKLGVSAQPFDALSMTVGCAFDWWDELGRRVIYAGGTPSVVDYTTQKIRPYLKLRYSLGAVSAQYHLEALKKWVDTTDAANNYDSGLIWRSVGSLSAQF